MKTVPFGRRSVTTPWTRTRCSAGCSGSNRSSESIDCTGSDCGDAGGGSRIVTCASPGTNTWMLRSCLRSLKMDPAAPWTLTLASTSSSGSFPPTTGSRALNLYDPETSVRAAFNPLATTAWTVPSASTNWLS